MTVILIDDSNSTGGAQNLVDLLADKINMIPETACRKMTSKEVLGIDGKATVVINCTDWCPEGYRYAEKIKPLCEHMYLLSQISFFKPFSGLYIDYEHHLWNRREKAKEYYDAVITLSSFQDALWKAAGWNTICTPWLNGFLNREKITKIVLCAAHWNRNKNYDVTIALAYNLAETLHLRKDCIEAHSMDENPSSPNDMFKPGVLYLHNSITDVNPMTIYEASQRDAVVVVTRFPGRDTLLNYWDTKNVFKLEEFNDNFLDSYYGLDRIKRLLQAEVNYTDDGLCYRISATEIMNELKAVMESYEPKFSDFGYECKPIKKRGETK